MAVDGASFVDGGYTVTVTGRTAAGFEVTRSTPFTVSRSLGLVTAAPELFSPNGDGRNDRLTLSFALTVPADVQVTILREGRWVATPVAASYAAGAHTFVWDGRRAAGSLRDGSYEALDTKLARHGNPSHILQLCFYSTELGRLQGREPGRIHVRLGSGETVTYRPDDFAAYYRREGAFYRAAILMQRLVEVRSLAELAAVGEAPWEAAGQLVARFHRAGVDHADLNAHNILFDDQRGWMIDFDRSLLRIPATRWRNANLERLQRSLRKHRGTRSIERVDAEFGQLRAAYDAAWQRGY